MKAEVNKAIRLSDSELLRPQSLPFLLSEKASAVGGFSERRVGRTGAKGSPKRHGGFLMGILGWELDKREIFGDFFRGVLDGIFIGAWEISWDFMGVCGISWD